MGLAGNVVCLRAADGKLVWQRNLVTDFGGAIPAWSYRESPLIDGDKLICTPGSEGAMLVALDKLTGQTIWKTRMPGSSESAPSSASNPGGGPGGERGGGTGSGVTGTKDPKLFVSEHWGMAAFSQKVPNGKYVAKLYFAGTCQSPCATLPFCDRHVCIPRFKYLPAHNRGIPVPKEPTTIGGHLRRRRLQLKLLQSQAASKLGVSTVTMSRWERDAVYPTWHFQPRIAAYLGYDPFTDPSLGSPKGNETQFVAILSSGSPTNIGQRIGLFVITAGGYETFAQELSKGHMKFD